MPNRTERDGNPYSPPRPGKLAARHTLIGEIVMGWQMISIGVSGQVGGHGGEYLHKVLESMSIADIWGYMFLLSGVFMVQGAVIEFLWGKYWKDEAIMRAAWYRKYCALSAAIVWFIAAYLQVTTPLRGFISMSLTTPAFFALSCYIYWETTRVYTFIESWTTARIR